ncbi:MAG: hypothetical protein FJ295_07190 [Planctomycetes bacterium]|nr:hypothetical protein [Planctomycetota bacterium]
MLRHWIGILIPALLLPVTAVAADGFNYDIEDSQVAAAGFCSDCNRSGSPCGSTNYWHDCQGAVRYGSSNVCDTWLGDLWDNTEGFLFVDSFKNIGDATGTLGSLDNSLGARMGFNSGFRLGESSIRGQFGLGYGGYDWKGRFNLGGIVPASPWEKQFFVTAGVYQRSDICSDVPISWGIVFDELVTDQWGFLAQDFTMGQFRGQIGYAINECHEIGIRASWGAQPGNALTFLTPGNPGTTAKPMDQCTGFWHKHWDWGADTNLFLGFVNRADVGDWLFGFDVRAPLSESTAFFGGLTYVAPSAASGNAGVLQETWNLSLGLVFSFGGKAATENVSGYAGLPLIPVADNGSFLITD